MKKNSNWDYYSVRIIKQIIVEGEPVPELLDDNYADDSKNCFEEVFMLIRAQSVNHAYKIAGKKAVQDEQAGTNVYGQQVVWKFIKAVDCFLILDRLTSGVEIYSCLHYTDKNVSACEFVQTWFNGDDGENAE